MPRLYVLEGPMKGHTFDLEKSSIFLGRSSDNDIQIEDGAISRTHLKIFGIGEMLFIEDLKSTNGTFINGELVVPGEGFEVGEEDTISIGNSVIRFGEILSVQDTATPDGEYEKEWKERRSRSMRDLTLIYKVSELLKQSLTNDEMLQKVLELLLETLPRIDRAAILHFDSQRGKITGMIARSRRDQAGKGEGASHYSRKVVERVLRNGEAVMISNTTQDKPLDFSENMDTLSIKAILCVPMIIRSKTCGAIYVDSLRGPYGFRDEDLLLLQSLSGSMAVVIENARLTSKLKELEKK